MSVITISSQLGSLGSEIARAAAAELNYRYVDRELVEKIMANYGIAALEIDEFDEKGPPLWDPLSIQRKKFLDIVKMAIYDLASNGGAVIVGRGGQLLLNSLPGILHVRIFAPLDVRLRRLIEADGVDEKHADQMIRENDQDSSAYIKHCFNGACEDPSLYDLLINTERISVETGVKLIIDSVNSREMKAGAQKAAGKLADLALMERAKTKLLELIGDRVQLERLEVKAEKGIVFLKGAIRSPLNVKECERAVGSLEGVERVENQLLVDQYHRFAP